MRTLNNIQSVIKKQIDELEFNGKPFELYEPIGYILSLGGKRLRPSLCLLACDMFSGEIEPAIAPGIGLEIFHNFTLLHDDIMDQAPIRRGMPTVHMKWNQNIAILSGDTMMAMAYEFVMKAPENVRSEVFSVFNKTAIEVCEGQQHDMNYETATDITISDYIEMIRLKTAVLLAGSLKIGALIGGAQAEQAEKLYRFGENLGIAFQLKDDLLDVFGEDEKFGKIKGGDIMSNKKTYLYLKAFELAKGDLLQHLQHFFSADFKDQNEKVAGVRQIYKELQTDRLAEFEIEGYYHKALSYLSEINLDENKKFELKALADDLKNRIF